MCELTVSLTLSGCKVLNYSWPKSIIERILSYILSQWHLLMRFWCSRKFSWVNCNPMRASLSLYYSLCQQQGRCSLPLLHSLCSMEGCIEMERGEKGGVDWALTCGKQDATHECATMKSLVVTYSRKLLSYSRTRWFDKHFLRLSCALPSLLSRL